MQTNLVDIRSVRVDVELPKKQRILEFIRQIKDPYNYKCGDIEIEARYADNAPPLEDCLRSLLS